MPEVFSFERLREDDITCDHWVTSHNETGMSKSDEKCNQLIEVEWQKTLSYYRCLSLTWNWEDWISHTSCKLYNHKKARPVSYKKEHQRLSIWTESAAIHENPPSHLINTPGTGGVGPFQREITSPITAGLDLINVDGHEEDVVEKIVRAERRNNMLRCIFKWKGYEDTTWESEATL